MGLLKKMERGIKSAIPSRYRKYFRSSKFQLIMERNQPIDLIVHVGAHYGEDAALYEGLGARTVLWVEADPDTHEVLRSEVSKRQGACRHIPHLGLVSENSGETFEFYRFAGDGASNSVSKSTDLWKERFQQSGETGETLELVSQTLSEILEHYDIKLEKFGTSMLVVDVQGHELAVLKGSEGRIGEFDFLKVEVSRAAFYESGVLFPELDSHICGKGYRLVSHRYARVPKHGDVLYQRGA